jgi:hypothetical protein
MMRREQLELPRAHHGGALRLVMVMSEHVKDAVHQ